MTREAMLDAAYAKGRSDASELAQAWLASHDRVSDRDVIALRLLLGGDPRTYVRQPFIAAPPQCPDHDGDCGSGVLLNSDYDTPTRSRGALA